MNPSQALSYLDSLIELGVKVGLDHTRALASAMGDPQTRFPALLIGGTNGKGSTASFLSAILERSGLRVGLYTSPHLVDVCERIRISGDLITAEAFAEGMRRVRETAERCMETRSAEGFPTYFEALTLLCFDYFASRGIDVAVLEVGLGGRLDCTNIVEPKITVVTNVGMDHEEWLGRDLPTITREKAGIFRPGVPAFTAAKNPEVLGVLEAEARSAGTPLHRLSDCAVCAGDSEWELAGGGHTLTLPRPGLLGLHQVENAALAVRCAWSLEEMGWKIPVEAIRRGVREARWPGRLERVSAAPDVYLDGAHNPDGCEALARFVGGLGAGRKALVFTAMKDKPVEAMVRLLAPHFGRIVATSLPMPRCCGADEIAARISGTGVTAVSDPEAALEGAKEWAGEGGVVVASGSLYLVGYLKALQDDHFSKSWGSGL
jgi:dihydrofolate synthase / folylpolyglutamate synthase